jgi:hypothetical protein
MIAAPDAFARPAHAKVAAMRIAGHPPIRCSKNERSDLARLLAGFFSPVAGRRAFVHAGGARGGAAARKVVRKAMQSGPGNLWNRRFIPN